MTCWIVVYAVSVTGTTPFSNRKKTSDGVLTYQEWNAIMDNLDSLNVEWWDDSIPAWAIMAFKTNCPAGWSRFSEADGKFLRWNQTFNTNYGNWRWAESHTLTPDEMPAHTHYIMNDSDEGSITDRGIAVDEFRTKRIQNRTLIAHAHRANDDSNDWYNLWWANVSANAWKSSSVWSSMSFSIMNPYIYVIYCVKN